MVTAGDERRVTLSWQRRRRAVIEPSRGAATIARMDTVIDRAADAGLVVDTLTAARRPLRVAVVTETYPPEVNGVALTVARVVDGLHRRGHDVQLVRPRQAAAHEAQSGPRRQELLTRGLPIPRYPQLRLGLPARSALLRLWQLARPDVVHIATEGPLGWSALQAASHLKIPLASDFRTNFHAYSAHYGVGWLRRPITAYLRKFHNRTQVTMVPTEPLRRELAACGFRNVVVVARGVDTALFSPARRSQALRAAWGAAPGDLVVACVGRLAAEKNIELVLRAFEAVRRLQPRARLLFVGDGPLRGDLERRAPHAVFAGECRGEALAAHYASADVFAFASLTETFGNVTAEAMASGLAVVAFDYAAAAQLVVNGESGLLAPFGDEDAFVRAAVAVAADAALRHRCGAAAHERARALDWDSVVARFEAVLRQAIDSRALPAGAAVPAASAA